jgi:catecholate siderophore receptor
LRTLKSNLSVRTAVGVSSASLASAAAISAAFGQQLATNDDTSVETVVVTGQKTSLGLLPNTILNTPQTIDVVPAKLIQEQGVNNLEDAIKNVPGITLNSGEGGTHGDLVNLRGFSVSDDYFLDGLRDTGLYTRDTFDYESVEVLKGPSSTLFGRGTTGGAINQVTKSPELFSIQDYALTGGTNAEIRGTADVNYVLGDTSAVRVDLMGQRNNFDGQPFARNQRWGIAPSLAYGLGTDTVWTLKYLHQQQDDLPNTGVPFLFDEPAPVPKNAFYGLPSDDRQKTDVEVVTGKVEHRFDDVFSISDSARFGSYWFDARETNAHYGTANCYTLAPYAGAPVCATTAKPTPVTPSNPLFPVDGIPISQIFVQRDRPSSEGTVRTLMNETDLTADFSFGFVHNHATFGVQLDKEDADLTRYANQDTTIIATPLLAPNPNEAFPGRQTTVTSRPVTKTATIGTYLVDNIDIGTQWSVIGALRFDHFGANYTQPVGKATHFTHNDNIGSPRIAVVYKPVENASVYFSYGTSFNPSAETLSLSASNQGLSPERDHTIEVGGKVAVFDGLLALTGAAFNTVMTNARISDPDNPGLQELAGTERVNGVEFGAQGHITEQWEVTAGYTYLAPHAVGLIAAGVPGPIPNVAHNQANLWTVYDWESGLKTGLGVDWLGRREAAADTASDPVVILTAQVPSYVTVDAMAAYPVSDKLSLALNAYNLGNTFYYTNSYFSSPMENHIVPGVGRTFLLTANLSL